MQHPRQGATGTAEILEGGQLHGVSIQNLDLAALGLKGIVGMRTQQFTFPEEATVQVFGRAFARCHTFTAFTVVLGYPTAGDGINEMLIRRSRLMRFGRSNCARLDPLLLVASCPQAQSEQQVYAENYNNDWLHFVEHPEWQRID